MPKEIDGEKFFTQDELDELISKRIKRERNNLDRKKEVVSDFLSSKGITEESLDELLTKDGKELELKFNKANSELKTALSQLEETKKLLGESSAKHDTMVVERELLSAIGDSADEKQRSLLLKAFSADFSVSDSGAVLNSEGKSPVDFFNKYLSENEFAKKPQDIGSKKRGSQHVGPAKVDDNEKPKTHVVPWHSKGASLIERMTSKDGE